LAIDSYINYSWDFPKEKRKLKEFIKDIIRSKGKFRKDRQIIRIISNKEKNLSKLSEGLKKFFGIKSKIYKMKNGFGTVYYELNINDKADIQSLINLNIL
jgi:arginine repressor